MKKINVQQAAKSLQRCMDKLKNETISVQQAAKSLQQSLDKLQWFSKP